MLFMHWYLFMKSEVINWALITPVSHCVTGALNDFQKDKQFEKLNAAKDTIEVKVMRDGKEKLVQNLEVVVGDILVLDTGDKIVADGLCIESYGLVIDEASLTGESEPLAKDVQEDPWCRSGTQVCISQQSASAWFILISPLVFQKFCTLTQFFYLATAACKIIFFTLTLSII